MLEAADSCGPIAEWVNPLVEDPEYCELRLHGAMQPLGITFMKATDWLLVAKTETRDIEEGSVLRAVNGRGVLLLPSADDALALVKGASWPMRLQFIRPPRFQGALSMREAAALASAALRAARG